MHYSVKRNFYFLRSLAILTGFCLLINIGVLGQNKKMNNDKKQSISYHSGQYRNVFLEAGYSQPDIDAKVAKAYTDLFEGPNRIYFEVGDTMAYVSDLKNHDVRTEGMSME